MYGNRSESQAKTEKEKRDIYAKELGTTSLYVVSSATNSDPFTSCTNGRSKKEKRGGKNEDTN